MILDNNWVRAHLFEGLVGLEAPTAVASLHHICLCIQSLRETLVLTAVACGTYLTGKRKQGEKVTQ